MRSALLLLSAATLICGCQKDGTLSPDARPGDAHRDDARHDDDRGRDDLAEQGRQTFRFDTFGDEDFWGGTLRLHEAIEGAAHGGTGPGVSPATALAVGLKVDVDALPLAVQNAIAAGQVDLNSPDTTLALLDLNAVVGVTGFKDGNGGLKSIGIQCALCHSTVDNSFAPGIGHRLDGWPARDLNVGAIIGLAPNLQPFADELGVSTDTVRAVLASWGPGKFDAQLALDGKAFQPDGRSASVLIPAAFGLAGVNLNTSTGFGSTTYWNAFVANLEMHGKGNFVDSRLDDASKFPVAAKNGFGHVKSEIDLITPKLAGLHEYQLSLPAPRAPEGSFDKAAAKRGRESSRASPSALSATSRRSTASRGGTCTPARRSASMISRPRGRPMDVTGPLPCAGSPPHAARAATITTGVSPPSRTSSSITTRLSRSGSHRARRRTSCSS